MRNVFKFFLLVAGIAATAVSCTKEIEPVEVQGPLKLVIRAGVPATKTAITDNGDKTYTPSWSANDAIGVYFSSVTGESIEFINADAGNMAFFEPSGEITGVSGDQTLYSFYPRGAFVETVSGKNIRVTVKDNQTPNAAGTFDKDADILVARPYAGNIETITTDGGIIDLEFARLLSVVKLTPTDNTSVDPLTSKKVLDGETVKSIKIEYNGTTGNDPLTGRVKLDLETGEFSDWTIKTYSATVDYGDNAFALNGTNAGYLIVNPATIASGKTVTFTVKTNKHDASKSFDLTKALAFPAGNVAIINLSIDDTWTIEDNTLDPNIIFKAPFTANINSNTTYDQATYGNLGVVGSSKSTITYAFEGTGQLRNNTNKISDDDASFYWCSNSTGLVIGGINAGSNQFFNLTFDGKLPSNAANNASASLVLSISQDGTHFFPITASSPVAFTGKTVSSPSYNFSIPAGEHTSLSLKIENTSSVQVVMDNLTLTKLNEAGTSNHAVSFDVVAVDPTLEVTPSPVNLLEGATQQLTVTGTNGALSYESNNTGVATVSSTGLITAVAEGTTTIDITSAATDEYNAGSTSVTVNVSAALSFETVTITETWSADLKNMDGNNAKFVDDGQGIWTVDASYGHKASSNANSASFYSPKFNMSSITGGNIKFSHTGNVTGEDYQNLGKAYYTLDNGSTWNQIALSNPASNYNWQTATIESSVYSGETIQFRWDFQGNSSKTWEVKDFVITVPVHRTITITQPSEGGSIAATVDDAPISSGASVVVGKTVVLTATPASGFEFNEWNVDGATVGNATATSTSFTVGSSNVTVTASFTPESTANAYTYIFTNKAWAATRNNVAENWTSGKEGGQLQNGRGIQVTTSQTGANGTSKYEFTDIEQVVVVYSTNASAGAGSIDVQVGNNTSKSLSVTSSGGTTDRELKFNYSTKESGKVKVTINCTTNSIYIKSVTIKAAAIVLPTAYNITCATGLDNGSVSVSGNLTSAYEGDSVTLIATPESGYKLDSWNVYKTSDSNVKVTVTNNVITMPAYDVTVSASFTAQGGGTAPVNGVCFNLTSYGSIPDGWSQNSVTTGSYYKIDAGGYMISPAYDLTGCSTATVSVKVAKYGSGTDPAAKLYVSYDGGTTWTESKTLTAPTDKNYLDAQTLSLSNTFTNNVKIKLENPTGNASLRVQNFSFTTN